ncbi:hypothetical protein PQX77_011882 [Marasmius sp. AFHP31]|nr:hypothetical protein PQX77_011882 [Marasmius sp. AFHP31]
MANSSTYKPTSNKTSDTSSPNAPYYTVTDLVDIKRRMKYDIESIQAKVADLERAMVEARRKEEELVSALNSLENLSSAIFGLPDEILAIIFENMAQADTGGHTMSKNAASWVIAQTCQRWRQLALSTPSIWTSIRMNTFFLSRQPVEMLKTWLERSQGLPLSCLLFLNQSPCIADLEDELFQLVLVNSHRWRHLEVHLESRYDLYRRFASTKDIPFPLLHSLRIFVNMLGVVDDGIPPLSTAATLTAPSLVDASLLILVPSSLESIITLPWSQLTELSLSFITSARFNEIMTCSKRLERCYLQLHSRFVLGEQMISLPMSLRRLHLTGPLLNVVNTLSSLSSPGLVELGLSPPGGSTVPLLTARRLLQSIAQLQTRSSCQLRRLYIPITLFSFPESPRIANCLSTVQALHLRLEGKKGSEEAIRTIKTSDIFRNLKELHLMVYKDGVGEAFVSSLPAFVDMVEARRFLSGSRGSGQYTSLQCLVIDMIRYGNRSKARLPVNREVAERLSRLERDGLIILGHVADGEWQPQHPTTHWDLEANQRRWARFGYCDWLFA